jgi:drug/metabolite transporter, DME family
MTDSGTTSTSGAHDEASVSEHRAGLRIGVILGVISSVCYAVANLALRQVAIPDDFGWAVWVTALKAVPATIVAWVLIGVRIQKKLPALPPKPLVGKLILAAILMQYGGNLCFQMSLSLGGLAISVPLCFATLILTGAWLGRVFLGDPISRKTFYSIAVLGVSILFLTAGADAAATSMHKDATKWTIVAAVVAASFSGFSYGACGVMIRQLTQNLSLSASLVIFSTVGVVALTGHVLVISDHDEQLRILAMTREYWLPLLASGVFNAAAFFAVAGALRRVPVTFVNVLNTSQNAMCAIAGVVIFSEPLTTPLVIGCGLTIVGLLMVDSGKKPDQDQAMVSAETSGKD